MPAGVSRPSDASAASVACIPAVAAHLAEWLDRGLSPQPAGVSARQALASALS
jgi:hypothetical protein